MTENKITGEPQPNDVDRKSKEIGTVMLGRDDLEEKKPKPRFGLWCLRYSNWVSEVSEDDLCEWFEMYFVGDECRDCPHLSFNATIRRLPLTDLPKPIYYGWEYGENKDLQDCEHGSMFLWWRGYPEKPKGEWVKLYKKKKCKCKSPQKNSHEKNVPQSPSACEEGKDMVHEHD